MSLRSAGYDAVVLINERILNQISGALFYNGFLRIARDIDLIELLDPAARTKIDPALHKFLKVSVRAHLLHEPSIDFLEATDSSVPFRMRLSFDLRTIVTLWDGLELPLGARMSLVAGCSIERVPEKVTGEATDQSGLQPDTTLMDKLVAQSRENFAPGTQMILLDLASSDLETLNISWDARKQQSLSLELGDLVMTVVRDYLGEQDQCFALALPSIGSELPDHPEANNPPPPYWQPLGQPAPPVEGPNRIDCQIAHCRVLSGDTLAIAFNLFDYQGGNPDQLRNFARNCSVGLALPEVAIHKVIDYGWPRLLQGKVFGGIKSFTDPDVDDFVHKVGKAYNVVERIAHELASLGFIESKTSFHGLRFVVGYWAEFPYKPSIDFLPGNHVRLTNARTRGLFTLSVLLDVETVKEVDPTGWLPDFIPDREISRDRREVEICRIRLMLNDVGLREATAQVILNEQTNALALTLDSIDLAIDTAISLFPGCPFLSFPAGIRERVLNLIEWILVNARRPLLSVFPPVQLATPLVPWPINVRARKLDIQADELTVALDAWYEPLQQHVPYVPKYIVNTNNGEIHLLGCSALKDTYEEHQRGYHLLNDAVNRGYDGCGRCLPTLHSR